ncbi:MAG: DNA translocase FtsK 4TM domain-containing protein, partial [Rickettsia endosymbiont of Ixodes persulcatus]|nr:DNA translocase FtsK 4TM domain-containing protein [Rickettsia endosymbiont of Ixodes persulcatus]
MIEKISSFCKTAVLFLISTFAFVAIVNYNSTDPSLNTVSTVDYKFENPFGIVGAYLSDIVVQIFGVGGILVPIFSIMYLVFRSKFGNLLYVLFWSILLVTICGLISKTSLEIFERYHHGGFIGDIFSRYSGYTMVSMITFSVLGIIGYHKIYLHLKGLLYKLLIRVTSPKVRTSVSEKEDVEEDNIFPPIPIEQTRDSIVKKIQNKVQNKVQKICMDETFEEFSIPPLTLLTAFKATRKKENAEIGNVELLKEVLNDFGIQGEIINICYGPVVILYELSP